VKEDVALKPMERRAIPTGLVVAVPPGYEVQVRPRSGLALNSGVTVANAPGTVDSDYRGELMVVLVNLSNETYTVKRGERIAQLVVAPVVRGTFTVAESLPPSERGPGGFGSTGA
jgi:dUTP pyrophosphatase